MHDPSLAPEGKHIVTIDVNSQPYHLREGDWDDDQATRRRPGDRAARDALPGPAGLDPAPPGALARSTWSGVIGLTGGHALHGDMAPDQLSSLRPVRGYAEYRTPLAGLYLCGAGTHPGGGVTGANGRNCAREVLQRPALCGASAAGRRDVPADRPG